MEQIVKGGDFMTDKRLPEPYDRTIESADEISHVRTTSRWCSRYKSIILSTRDEQVNICHRPRRGFVNGG